MFELEINGKNYELSFGMGFVRMINETVKVPVEGVAGMFAKRGLNYAIGSLIDGDIEKLQDVILMASKAAKSGLTQKELDEHFERPDTDIDALFKTVLDFFEQSNCTAKQYREMMAAVKAEQERMAKQ